MQGFKINIPVVSSVFPSRNKQENGKKTYLVSSSSMKSLALHSGYYPNFGANWKYEIGH
jgi:hypothetical protein